LSGKTVSFEDEVEYPDGGTRSTVMTFIPDFDDAGTVRGGFALVVDITERKRAEQALRESRDQLRLITDNLPVLITYMDTEERFRFANMTAERWYGRPATEILDRSVKDVLGASAYGKFQPRIKDALSGKGVTYEEAVEYPDGAVRTVEVTYVPDFATMGVVRGYFCLVADITHRKQAEECAAEAQRRLVDAIESLPASFILFDADDRLVICNDATKRMIDWQRDLLVPGARYEDLLRDTVTKGKLVRAQGQEEAWLRRRLASNRSTQAPFESQLVDGRWFLTYERATSDGGTVAIHLDISERKRAEEALRESEARFRAVVDNSPLAIILKDREGRYLLVNKQYETWFDAPSDTIVEKTNYDVFPRELADQFAANDRQVMETGEAIEREVKFPVPDGTFRDMLVVKFPIYGPDRQVTGIGVIESDITDRKKATEELRRNEERLQQATRLARIGYWIWDAVADRCIYCSEEHARIHGVSVDEYMARASTLDGDFSFVHPGDKKECGAAFRALRNGTGFDMEYRVATPDGETRYVREIARPIFDETGTVIQEHGTIQDITESKQAEEALRQSEERFRSVVDNSPTAIVLKSLDGRYQVLNKRFHEWYGAANGDLSGKTSRDLFPAAQAEKLIAQEREALHKMAAVQREHELTFPEGSQHTVVVTKFPFFDNEGHVIGLCTIDADVTEQRRAEEQLRQAHKMEAVGQLTGGVAHDFNNLLAVISGNLELLAEAFKGDDAVGKHTSPALSAVRRGAALTQRLLAFSRRQALMPKPVDLDKLVSGMRELLARTLGETIEIKTFGARDLWTCEVDPSQLENALLNLTINARDAMPGGGRLTIETANAWLDDDYAAAQTDVAPGQYVMLAVTDNGSGMPAEILQRIFEPFFTTKEVGKGSGLGLSMVYGFVKQSSGHVRIYSEPGQGTTVKIYLPRSKADVPTGVKEPTTDRAAVGHGETVLVVEDNPDVRTLAVVLLQGLGYDVLEAASAGSALELLETNSRANLLFTDIMLPGGMNGRDLAHDVRQRYPGIKVLYMSGYSENAAVHQDLLDCDAPLLAKPFRKADLARKLREVLDGE
jgi:PAS domain S-box-containing protein